MKKKINWGTGIIITFIVFIISVLTQVIFYMNTDVDLVTDNYYEKELSYDEHISKINNTGTLGHDLNIEYFRDTIIIRFPTNMRMIRYQVTSGSTAL